MSTARARTRIFLFFTAVCALGAPACGASINAVYEGDVRFEHCMALDVQPEEKPATRKGCWTEWVGYYTFGQTRDRVEYARRRLRQLAHPNGLDDDGEMSQTAHRAVPEPTNVLAPPPMILADAGRPPEPDASTDAAVDVVEPPAAACASQCRDAWTLCKQACSNAACEKTCATKYKTCMRRCF